MKKFLLLILVLFALTNLLALAIHQTIPKEMKNSYRMEIQNKINYLIPISLQVINKIEIEIKNEKNPYIKNMIVSDGISGELLKFYIELFKITNKYTTTPISVPNTDWYGELKNILDPYFKSNHINTLKIQYLIFYAKIKQFQYKKMFIQ